MKVLLFLLIYLPGELLAHFVFSYIRKRFEHPEGVGSVVEQRNKMNTIAKGLLERFFLFLCLINDLGAALTVLGALKLGTRLDTDKQHPVSNDYFLIGNITSILFAIIYFLVWQKWGEGIINWLA
ncbi:hypothetical protein [Rufibacter psychrotolerans]|uniref:hypothetical protein n=1 Tax=Rufibacter psychrotolerans TaxID=2812556 RepID=UPI00196896C8|nr:hypothetical protein [Rufibacter sp. SYSU D00308]